jgi:transcription termination factor Rho
LLSQRARRILGAARTFKEGGSVTVIAAVALEAVEESPFFLKDAMAVANSCATIESGLVKIPESFTFTKDKLLTEDELNLANKLEKFLEKQNESERQTIFNDILTKTNTNRELANRIDSWLDLLRG